jgi:hypothetical protein
MAGRYGHNTNRSRLLIRTSDAHAPEVLVRAFRVVARAACSFVLAEWLLGIDLVTIGWGQEAARHVLCKVGVVAIRFEHAERTLVCSESRHFGLVVCQNLFLVSWACCRVVNVQLPTQILAAASVLGHRQR